MKKNGWTLGLHFSTIGNKNKIKYNNNKKKYYMHTEREREFMSCERDNCKNKMENIY